MDYPENTMEKIVGLAKRRGFVFPSAEIYGGLGAVYDYGPLGTMMKENIRSLWREWFVSGRLSDMFGQIVPIESSILTNRDVLVSSGHESGFSDPLVECKICHGRFRADQDIPEAKNHKHDLTESKQFNLMFKTHSGPVEEKGNLVYLRPETAQGMFVNFKLVAESMRLKPPFGIAQIGKAFRNEITVGNFIFRLREFEQAEIEYFVPADKADHFFGLWVTMWEDFFRQVGLVDEEEGGRLRLRKHSREELAHYSSATTDIEYEFPFGWSELAGIANRGDFDLQAHIKHSNQDLSFFDDESKEKFVPHVIEPTLGIDRLLMAILVNSYQESDGSDGREKGDVVLKISSRIAPVKVAVFPLVKKDGLPEIADEVVTTLRESGVGYIQYDQSGSIGRRYRRQDEIGTPWCITVDGQSKDDKTVTVRDRDTLKQERVKIGELEDYFKNKLN